MSGWLTNGMPNISPVPGNGYVPVDVPSSQGAAPIVGYSTLSQLSTPVAGRPLWVAGRFYGLPDSCTPVAVTPSASTLYAYPLLIPQTTIKTLNISVTTGQTGGAAHYGLYADNGAGYPGALVYDGGAITGLTSTSVVTTTLGTPLALAGGLYWVASIFSATSTLPSVIGITAAYTNNLMGLLGSDTAAHLLATSGEAPTGISVSGTYGALPSTFTASATLTQNAATPALGFGV